MTKLNVGCGPHLAEGWLNIDTYTGEKFQPDSVMSALMLRLHNESVSHVYMGHVLEHIPFEEVQRALDEAWRVLEPGGELVIVGPDWEKAFLADDTDKMREIEDGGGEWEGDDHEWTCDSETLSIVLENSVFDDWEKVELDDLEDWPVVSFAYWQCAFKAVKNA